MRFTGVVWRAHNPEWSWDPLSGEGARLHGGRFNPKGLAALYMSLDVMTAVREASPLGRPFQPMTLCQYAVDCDDIVDLRTAPDRRAAGVADEALDCPNWRGEMASGTRPASQGLAEGLFAGGAAGLLVRSYAAGADGANLVLWRWSSQRPHRLQVVDPDERLPKDGASWRRRS